MDFNDMSIDELNGLMEDLQDHVDLRIHQKQVEEADARTRLANSIATLSNLLGPDQPTEPTMEQIEAGEVSITQMRLFSAEQLEPYGGLVDTLVLAGMEILTRAVRDIATVIGRV